MFSKKFIKGLAVFASSAIFSLSTIQSAYAGPGTLATAPLFLSTIVEPNVFLTLDDSGSMDWGPMVAESAIFTTSGGLPWVGHSSCLNTTVSPAQELPNYDPDDDDPCLLRRGHYVPGFEDTRDVLPPADGTDPEWDKTWVIRNHLFNRNYYNPSIKYSPWVGTESDGVTPMFTDADPTAALRDAENSSPSVDLTVMHTYSETTPEREDPDLDEMTVTSTTMWIPTYFTWVDDNPANGRIDVTDTHTEVQIAAGTTEMQNFANWFQYYRKRMDGTKRIIGGSINTTDASRMGMRLFNDGQKKDLKTMGDTTFKRELLEELYKIDPGGNTPARQSLKDTGEYFENDSNAIFSAANGGECQQNFNILMSDGFWNGGNPKGIGHRDRNGDGNDTIFDGPAVGPGKSNDGGNYADDFRRTLADVAMKYYETDLRTDLANNVPTQTGVDEADHQHLVNFTIAFGLTGTLDPLVDDPLAVGFNWPEPISNSATTIDDMWHAAYNSRGEYLSAQDPEQLQTSLNAALANIAERTATAAAVSINSAKLTTQSTVYLAQFNTNRWQGNLFAFKIVDLDTGELAVTPDWGAGDVLLARNIVANPRVILTQDGSDGVPFQWTNLSTAQKADLKTNAAGGTDPDAIGIARLEYLHGDRTNEASGFGFRERLSLLGDLVNSGPVFVGAPALNWPDTAPFPTATGTRYSDFKNGPAAARDGMIYAGANDGMLHGFAEVDGEERIAYIANNLFSTNTNDGLHYLTDQSYQHRYYNDLTPSLSDIYADLGSGNRWSTILISGQRGGSRGMYALDVTDPSSFSEGNASNTVLWEFNNSDDADLGFTYSRPQIGLANNGRWVAIFGNGYNDTGDGEAKLFILDIALGADGAWAGGDYIEITTNSGTPGNRNGLATPALADLDGNGTIDRVYAGDLNGQMWVFDLSDTSSASWDIPGTDPLFTTINSEPITAAPTLSKHPSESDSAGNAPNVMVFFGSGQYLTDADKTNTDDNHFYGVWDRGDDDVDDSDLVEQFFQPGFLDSLGNPVRVLSQNPVDYASGTDYGWFFDLPDNGERSVTRPVVRGGIVFFNTFVPNIDPCSVGGFGYRMAVNMENGGQPTANTIDTNMDGVIDDNDKASDGSVTAFVSGLRQDGFLPEPVFIEDIAYTAETPSKVAGLPKIPEGRFSWQELIQ